jgi:hypothetical protein
MTDLTPIGITRLSEQRLIDCTAIQIRDRSHQVDY